MGVGTSVKRLDAIQKVTGSAKYVEDLIPLDALHMKVVHSTIANGLVTAIDTTEAERMPGCLLYTSPSPRDRQKSRMPSSA